MAEPKPNPRPTLLSNQYNLVFTGTTAGYTKIWFPWAVLSIATFGVGWFWLHSKRRRYLATNMSFLTGSFDYAGNGVGEFTKVLPWLLLPILASLVLFEVTKAEQQWQPFTIASGTLIWILCLPSAFHQWHRYVINHTSWAGNPLRYGTVTAQYTSQWVLGFLLSLVTIGFYYPHWRNQMFGLRYNNIYCGDWALLYTGQGRDVFEDYVSAVPAIIVTGGGFAAWFVSKITRYRIANIWIGGQSIGSARGYFGFKGEDFLLNWCLHILLVPLTLGIAIPALTIRRIYAQLSKIAMIGNLDFSSIIRTQIPDSAPKPGQRAPY